jgi:hypothetical protein
MKTHKSSDGTTSQEGTSSVPSADGMLYSESRCQPDPWYVSARAVGRNHWRRYRSRPSRLVPAQPERATALGDTRPDVRGSALKASPRRPLAHPSLRFAAQDQVSTLDIVTFTVAPVLLGAAALVATFLPAQRATRIEPMRVLRSQ